MASLQDKIKATAKNTVKSVANKIKKIIVQIAATLFIKLLPYILIACLLSALISGISWLFEILTAEDTEKAVTDALKSLGSEDLLSTVEIKEDSSGHYITYDHRGLVEKVEENLDKYDVDLADLGVDDMSALESFFAAEIATQVPNLSDNPENTKTEDGKIQGAVKIKRQTVDKKIGSMEKVTKKNKKEYYMTYVEQDTFDNYVKNNDKKALEHFTLDEDWNLITATWEYVGELKIQKNEEINFTDVLNKYTMQYQYPLAFLLDGLDEEFSIELSKLALNSEIIIVVQDNVTTTQTEVTTEVTRQYYSSDGSSVSASLGSSTQTTITETNFTNIEISYADGWCMQYEKEFNFKVDDTGMKLMTEETTQGEIVSTETNSYRDSKTMTTKQRTITTEYNQAPGEEPKTVGKEKKFIELFNNSEEAKDNIMSEPEWLYDILANSESTKDMVDLTKYLIYKATGKDQGVKEFDFGAYRNFLDAFGNTSSGVPGIPGIVYDFLLEKGLSPIGGAAVLGNIAQESAFRTDSISFDGYGSIGLCQWTGGRRKNLQKYAKSLGLKETDLEAQMNFLWKELTEGYSGLVKRLKNATNVDTATEDFCWTFERPSKAYANMAYRKKQANYYYKLYCKNNTGTGKNGSIIIRGTKLSTYTSSSGKRFIEYKQNRGPWASAPYAGSTIARVGCPLAAIATLTSGYGYNFTPDKWSTNGMISILGTIKKYTSKADMVSIGNYTANVGSYHKKDIQNHLRKKHEVIIHVIAPNTFAYSQHWMALLDINSNGSKVYVSNPNASGENGWVDINKVLKYLNHYIRCSK